MFILPWFMKHFGTTSPEPKYTRADAQKLMGEADNAHPKTRLAIAKSEVTHATDPEVIRDHAKSLLKRIEASHPTKDVVVPNGFKAWFMKHFQELIKFGRSFVN